jgi:hypothetical protein
MMPWQGEVPQAPMHLALIADTIRTAVAPVFLLTGVGSILMVLTNRLGRIVDRGRQIDATDKELHLLSADEEARVRSELAVLSQRARVVNLAITLTTVTALLVCAVIVLLFVGALLRVDVASGISVVFIGAMIAFIGALVTFLREIHLSMSMLHFGPGR